MLINIRTLPLGKGIEKRKVNKDYRKHYRIFLILFFLSFSANLFILILYVKERISWPSFMQARKEVKEVREVKSLKRTVPLPFIHVKNKDFFLLCEKDSKTLRLYRSEQNAFQLVKSYPCIVGSNNVR